MRYLFILFLVLAGAVKAGTLNPLDHTSLLLENDRKSQHRKAIDEEDPYFLLSGEADEAIAKGDYPAAVLRIREALAIDPANPSNALLLSNLGMVYNFMSQDSLALAAYDQALELAPAMSTVMANRGLLKLKMGRDNDAFADFAGVIERDSLNQTARFYHGLMALYGGQLNVAEADFEVLKDIAPESYDTNVALSTLYSLTRRDNEAIPYFKWLIQNDPSVEYYSALAGCYLGISDLPSASATMAEAFGKYGEDPELLYYRAWLNRDSYLMDAARCDAKRAIKLGADPKRVNALFEQN